MTRLIAVVFTALTLAAGYLTVYGLGAESADAARSIRSGSIGNTGRHGVK